MKLRLVLTGLCMGIIIAPITAAAITINGEQYLKVLGVETAGNFGYWTQNNKFFTFDSAVGPQTRDTEIKVSDVTAVAPKLSQFEVDSIYAMGLSSSAEWNTDIASGTIRLSDTTGANLLTARVGDIGRLRSITAPGIAGQAGFHGLFEVVSGVFLNRNLISESIYLSFAFDNVIHLDNRDIAARHGLLTIYSRAGEEPPRGEVPEPASAVLLAAGLLALRNRF